MRRRLIVCLAAAASALLITGAGQAAQPQQEPASSIGGNAPASARAESGRKLPFSGLDLALLTAGGAPLLLIGASLRRRQAAPKMQPAQEDSLTLA
jgi:hypothetical protein